MPKLQFSVSSDEISDVQMYTNAPVVFSILCRAENALRLVDEYLQNIEGVPEVTNLRIKIKEVLANAAEY